MYLSIWTSRHHASFCTVPYHTFSPFINMIRVGPLDIPKRAAPERRSNVVIAKENVRFKCLDFFLSSLLAWLIQQAPSSFGEYHGEGEEGRELCKHHAYSLSTSCSNQSIFWESWLLGVCLRSLRTIRVLAYFFRWPSTFFSHQVRQNGWKHLSFILSNETRYRGRSQRERKGVSRCSYSTKSGFGSYGSELRDPPTRDELERGIGVPSQTIVPFNMAMYQVCDVFYFISLSS